jgi:hypothetical protein
LKKTERTKKELATSIATTERALKDLEEQANQIAKKSISLQTEELAEYAKK